MLEHQAAGYPLQQEQRLERHGMDLPLSQPFVVRGACGACGQDVKTWQPRTSIDGVYYHTVYPLPADACHMDCCYRL